MGRVGDSELRPVIIGVAEADGEEPPTLNEALESAALRAIEEGFITNERPKVWFKIKFVEVELGNQHPRTMKVGVTPIGGGS